MRFEQFLIRNAAANGAKTALVTDRRRLGYAELDDLSTRLAAALAENGVKRNDRVLVFMDNCWEAAAAIFAILKAGATFSPINASTKADKLAYIVADCEAAAILTQAKLMPVVAEALALAPGHAPFVASTAAPGGRIPDGAASFEGCLTAAPAPRPPRRASTSTSAC
jgi:long-chain acyl-CoA synthetase